MTPTSESGMHWRESDTQPALCGVAATLPILWLWAESLLPTVLSLMEAIEPEESENYYGVSCSRQAAKLPKDPFTYR